MKYENQIICGDSLEVLKTFEAESIDLVVTSPPYDNLRDYKGYSFDFEGIAKQLFRVLKQGSVIVWVVNDQVIDGSESGTSFKQALYFKEIWLNLHDTMIYQKAGFSFPDQTRYNPVFEYMFVLSKGQPKTINLIADLKNRYAGEKVARLNSDRQKNGSLMPNSAYRNNPEKVVKELGVRNNIWYYKTGYGLTTEDTNAYEHPAMFPEQLAADHIKSWSNENDLVLDPFNGSGTTTKMARLLNRRFIGIEISEEYCKIAEDRLKQQVFNF